MYNAGLKDEYLEKFDKNTEEYERLFYLFDDVLDSYETKLDTDACQFDMDQANSLFVNIEGDSKLLNTYANDLLNYTVWCRKKNYTSTNIYSEFCFYYNGTQKNEYIAIENGRGIGRPKGFLEHIFRDASQYECVLNKDVCNFTKTEILGLYTLLNRPSISSLDVIHGQLKAYTQWCLSRHLVTDNQNHFNEVTRDMFIDCINVARQEKSVLSSETINDFINEIPNPCDAFLILAMFEGICGKHFSELLNLKLSDFDMDNKTVKLCSGRTISVSNQLIDLATDSAYEMVYFSFGKQLEISFQEADDTIMKNFPNSFEDTSDAQKSRRVYGRFNRIMDYLGVKGLRSNDITISGKIDFINRRCKELGMTGHEYLFSDHLEEVNKQYGGKLVRSTFEKAYGKYLPQ